MELKLTPPLRSKIPDFGRGGYNFPQNRAQILVGGYVFHSNLRFSGPKFSAALRAAGTKFSRFPLKESVFAVKNTQNCRGASRRFGRGVIIFPKIELKF